MPHPKTKRRRPASHIFSNDRADFLPPHEPTLPPGFHAYSNQWSLAPGDTLDLRASANAPGPVTIRIVRHRDHTSRAEPLCALGDFSVTQQPIHRGSYVHIPNPVQLAGAFTVELWCRPLVVMDRAGLMSHPAFVVMLEQGKPVCCISTTKGTFAVKGALIATREWHHLALVYDGKIAALFVNGLEQARTACEGKPIRSSAPLRLAAMGNDKEEAFHFFTGDLCNPAVYSRAMPIQEIAARHCNRADRPAKNCVGHWVFDAVGGAPFRDTMSSKRHGHGVNFPIRMIPGPRRVNDSDYATYDPLRDPDFGFAARFMSDAIVDCRWPLVAEWRAPDDLPSGQYAAELTHASGEKRLVHFIVRPKRSAKKSRRPRVLCISTTSTRCAYNFQPFANPDLDYGAYKVHPSYPLLGQILGWRRPATGEPWETTTVNFELPFYEWLHRAGIEHDVVAEWDLERDPSILDDYTVAAWAGHSEYWTVNQHEMLQKFHSRGGHLLALSGNTAFWRVTADLANSVIEVRKHDRRAMSGVSCDAMLHAGHHHQLDHLPGSYMHTTGWPQASLGLGQTNGCTNPPLEGPRAGYDVIKKSHELFRSPRKINTAFPFAPNAAGYETDLSLVSALELYGESQIARYPARDGSAEPTLARARKLTTQILARAKLPGSYVLDFDVNFFVGEMWSEMLWTPPQKNRGAVFASGSVLSPEVLLTNDNFSNFMLNVLDHMGIKTSK